MRLLIEEHQYLDPEIQDFLKEIGSRKNDGKIPFVGYMFSTKMNDCIFFLPKVILNNDGLVFHKYKPEDLWKKLTQDELKEQHGFLRSFPICIYQAINIYRHRNPTNIIVHQQQLAGTDQTDSVKHVTFFENILELIHFAEENKNFLLFKMQHMHNGKGKVNWQKTISHQDPLIKKGKALIYLNPYTKRKEIDYEEELLVIYLSVLNYINNQYGFSANINQNYKLMSKAQFDGYINGEGTRRLREIKYKYFSDRTLHIWRLCYIFFAQKEKLNNRSVHNEYLISSDFDRVFESMVDDLIGSDLPPHIKKAQEDGKEIDHLFVYDSLIDRKFKTFYIADSKYYHTENRSSIKGNSLFKQFTYARNLIQEDLPERRHHHDKWKQFIPCIDEKTEGYNIIPNFFLSAYIDKDYNYDKDGIQRREEKQRTWHFPNRLFDRETLLLCHYDINFLFVVKQYANNNIGAKAAFKRHIHHLFRKDLLARLNEEYSFSILELKEGTNSLESSLSPIFKILNGKLFCPREEESYTRLILALEKPEKAITDTKEKLEKERLMVHEALKTDFVIHTGYVLGDDVEEFLANI